MDSVGTHAKPTRSLGHGMSCINDEQCIQAGSLPRRRAHQTVNSCPPSTPYGVLHSIDTSGEGCYSYSPDQWYKIIAQFLHRTWACFLMPCRTSDTPASRIPSHQHARRQTYVCRYGTVAPEATTHPSILRTTDYRYVHLFLTLR